VLGALVQGKHKGYLSAHGLAGVYSVLTRTPCRPPLYPSEALSIVEDQVLGLLKLVSLNEKEYIDVVRKAAVAGWTGGRKHDAVHLQCARKMRCGRSYTFNPTDFWAIATKDLVDRVATP